ncbi:MAG: hypothetical protein EOO46_10760 [Flavobacterium sp.]|nr:MAG: hypothetical protein EOO46_10760 [Flavobacterium sp.]
MKLQYFATRTKNNELLGYVLAELTGYKERTNLPDYRITSATINVDIQFGEVKHPNLELPVEIIKGENRDLLRNFYIHDPVTVLEQMANIKAEKGGESQFLVLQLPLTMLDLFQDGASKLYRNPYYRAKVIGARILANRNIIPKALTSIRSRLLTFCMEIGETFGYNIEIGSFNKSQNSNNDKIVQLMNTVINNHGDGSIINTGAHSNIDATITITKGDKEQLVSKLKSLGIDQGDIEEIEAIVLEEKPDQENKKLGNKTIDWISKVSGKALKGAGGIAKEVTSSLLANLLMQYFGIPPIV